MRTSLSLLVLLFATIASAQATVPKCEGTPGRRAEALSGQVLRGKAFAQSTPSGWLLKLQPIEEGWLLEIGASDRPGEDMARLTPPLHGTANPRIIKGSHFRNAENTGPNDGTVNAPQELREFIFSPRVNRDIQGKNATASPTSEEVRAVQAFGRGWLFVESYRLTPARRGERAAFEELRFSACLTSPE